MRSFVPSSFVQLLSCALIGATSGAALADHLVYPNPTVVPHDQPYYTSDVRNTRLIYTEGNRDFAEQVAALELTLQPRYEASFGYELNETLYVGLISDYNQIANGFATQFPVNRQINYIGGALVTDYFSTTSWLDTLIYHETAHNYQTNARENPVSEGLYRFLGVGSFFTPVVPAITPNLFESSFILEGNAVLNESWHGNGGRLYNGRMKAMTLLQARAGYLTPARLYNQQLRFPYGESHYVFGGHYQYYLAEQYGLDRTNRYFLNRSAYWYWPLLVNSPTLDTFGRNFTDLMADWSSRLATQANGMAVAGGAPLAHSQFRGELNRNDDEIFFLTNPTGVRAPELVRIDRNSRAVTRERVEYPSGKLIENGGTLYSIAGRHTSPLRIHQGLYDRDAEILSGTEGRIIQGYLSDGRPVYFDVARSYSEPQLFVGDEFYAEVNSSVLIGDDDALYYFVQNGRTRTLFRDRTALLDLDTYYALIADVDSAGRVYFITNTEYGSSLFRLDTGTVERVTAADNIADARLVDDDTALVAAVSADEYYYTFQTLAPLADSEPHSPQLFWDPAGEPVPATPARQPAPKLALDNEYSALNDIRYQGTDVTLSYITTEMRDGSEQDNWLYTINASFADPLTQNRFNVFALRDADLSHLAGVGYTNSQYLVLAGLTAYGVLDEQLDQLEEPDTSRGYGLSAELRLPFLQSGYWYGELGAFHYLDYREREREPTGGQLLFSRQTRFGHSFYPNSRFVAQGFGVDDRDDTVSGGALALATDFPWQIYGGVKGKYARSDAEVDHFGRRGVNLEKTPDVLNNDPSILVIPGLVGSTYASEASYTEAHIAKVLDLDAYAFWFPLSLRRESLTVRYRHVDVNDSTRGGDVDFDQLALGLTLELVAFNVAPIRVAVEYVRSDETPMTDEDSVNAQLQLSF